MTDQLPTVTAVYPDKSKYKMTMEELKIYMAEQEMPICWQTHFFEALMDNRLAYGPIARYYLN